MLDMRRPETPVTLNFKEMEGSMYNTPPCWSIYVCGLVFKHLLAAGGLPGVKANNDAKAKLVYDAIAASNGFYSSPVEPSVRSNMNIPFTIPSSPDLEKAFVSEADKQKMVRSQYFHRVPCLCAFSKGARNKKGAGAREKLHAFQHPSCLWSESLCATLLAMLVALECLLPHGLMCSKT